MTVFSTVNSKPLPLQQDREIGWLLKFEHENPIGNGVRQACGHEHRITRVHNLGLQCTKQCRAIALAHPRRNLVKCHRILETHPDFGTNGGINDVPSFGLAV